MPASYSKDLEPDEMTVFLNHVFNDLVSRMDSLAEGQPSSSYGNQQAMALQDPQMRRLAAEFAVAMMNDTGRLSTLSNTRTFTENTYTEDFDEYLKAGAAAALMSKQYLDKQGKDLHSKLNEYDKLEEQLEAEKEKLKTMKDPSAAKKQEEVVEKLQQKVDEKKAEMVDIIGNMNKFERDPNKKEFTKDNARDIVDATKLLRDLAKLKNAPKDDPKKAKKQTQWEKLKEKFSKKPEPTPDKAADKDKDKDQDKNKKDKKGKSPNKDLAEEFNAMLNGTIPVTCIVPNTPGIPVCVINGHRPIEQESFDTADTVEGFEKLKEEEGTESSFLAEAEEAVELENEIGLPEAPISFLSDMSNDLNASKPGSAPEVSSTNVTEIGKNSPIASAHESLATVVADPPEGLSLSSSAPRPTPPGGMPV